MGAPEINGFLSALAVDGRVAASTQNQALSALLFLYRDVLDISLPWLDGTPRLMACLLYGAGLRVLKCFRLRVQDVDFTTNQIVVRGGKGDLARHLENMRAQHQQDLALGAGWVELPLLRHRTWRFRG